VRLIVPRCGDLCCESAAFFARWTRQVLFLGNSYTPNGIAPSRPTIQGGPAQLAYAHRSASQLGLVRPSLAPVLGIFKMFKYKYKKSKMFKSKKCSDSKIIQILFFYQNIKCSKRKNVQTLI
jgi:hypothetical protein